MELDGINYKFCIEFTDSTNTSVSITILDDSNCRIPSGFFFGISYSGLAKYCSINREFEFDRDEKNNDQVKIIGVDRLE